MTIKMRNSRILDSYLCQIYERIRHPVVYTGRLTDVNIDAYREYGCIVGRYSSAKSDARYNDYCRGAACLNFYRHAPASRRFADKAARMYA